MKKYKMNKEDFKTISLIIMNAIQDYMRKTNMFEDMNHLGQKSNKIIPDIKQEFNTQIDCMFETYELQVVDRCLLMKSLYENGVTMINLNTSKKEGI